MSLRKRYALIIMFVAAMQIIGFLIAGILADNQNENNAMYQKAIHIESEELFRYGMETNSGDAFVYGELKAIDTVSYPEIEGEYMCLLKVKERYERHERTVTEKDKDGETHTKTEYYYQWDEQSKESMHSSEISFCGVIFDYGKISSPGWDYIETISADREWSWSSGEYVKVRYKFYGTETEYTGTVFTTLADNTISDSSPFFDGKTPEEALKQSTSNIEIIVFWIFLEMICGIATYWIWIYLKKREVVKNKRRGWRQWKKECSAWSAERKQNMFFRKRQ